MIKHIAAIFFSLTLIIQSAAAQTEAITTPESIPDTMRIAVPADEQEAEPVVIGRRLTLYSEILGEDREILIGLPEDYTQSGEHYPVLYVVDGPDHFHHVTASAQILAHANEIPGLIVVGIANPERDRDLVPAEARNPSVLPLPFSADTIQIQITPDMARADEFLNFLEDELEPYLREHYRTAPFRLLFGHSLGGLFTTHAFLTRPDSFHAYIASSPSMGIYREVLNEMVPELFNTQSYKGRYFFSSVGEKEPYFVWESSWLPWAFEKFQPAGLHWWHRVLPGESHPTAHYPAVYDGLRKIFASYTISIPMAISGDLPGMEAHFERASGIYGYDIKMPIDLVNIMGYMRLEFGDLEGAVQIFRRNVELYSGSPGVYSSLADALEAAGEIVEALSNREEAVRLAEETGDERLEVFVRNRDDLREREE